MSINVFYIQIQNKINSTRISSNKGQSLLSFKFITFLSMFFLAFTTFLHLLPLDLSLYTQLNGISSVKNILSNIPSFLNKVISEFRVFGIDTLNWVGYKFLHNFFNYPVFLYLGVLFFLTTFLSLIFLNYLGLYGVFILNFFSLTSL